MFFYYALHVFSKKNLLCAFSVLWRIFGTSLLCIPDAFQCFFGFVDQVFFDLLMFFVAYLLCTLDVIRFFFKLLFPPPFLYVQMWKEFFL
jgi:hypothetical protein